VVDIHRGPSVRESLACMGWKLTLSSDVIYGPSLNVLFDITHDPLFSFGRNIWRAFQLTTPN
jgi:hypothetical protein